MTETRTSARHVLERTITADIEDVWRALTDPDDEQRSYYDLSLDSTWMPGETVRYVDLDGGCMIEGSIIDVDPPHRLQHTFSFTADGAADAAADAPSRVTFTMESDDEGTRVVLVHDELSQGSATWQHVEDGWEQLLDSLTQLFDAEDGDDD